MTQSAVGPSSETSSKTVEIDSALLTDMENRLDAIDKQFAIAELDLDGNFTNVNDLFCGASGYTKDELVGQHHRKLCDDTYARTTEYADFWNDLRQGKSHFGEFERRRKDGSALWIQAAYHVIRNAAGLPERVVKFASDITQDVFARRKAGQASSMMENSPTSMMFADRELIIQYQNPASENLLKTIEHELPVKANELVGQSIDIFHKNPSYQRKLLADDSQLPRQAEIQVGAELLDLLVSPIYDENGQYAGAMVTWSVITKQRATEKEAAEAQKREAERTQELEQKIDQILQVVNEAADGNLTVEVPVRGDDELGRMGTQLQNLLSEMRSSLAEIGRNTNLLAVSSEELTANSKQMGTNAKETESQATNVAAASEEVSTNVRTVAGGAEELGTSIREIARNSAEAAKVANHAVEEADATNETIKKLGDSSTEIGNVIKVITSIAQQTNLLALNATIEAARAGEAGKGFAVVANEVKELAKETARATEEIGQKIESIQTDTNAAVEAIAKISETIKKVNDIQGTIASAVEEQQATTSEITRSVKEAARGSQDISKGIAQVAKVAEQTSAGAGETETASHKLSEMSETLQELLAKFKV